MTQALLPRHRAHVDQGLILDSLRQSILFARADEGALDRHRAPAATSPVPAERDHLHQGDPGDALHIVSAGAVKIVLPSVDGEEAIIATLRSGDFFGELALLDGAPRSATAVAVEASETWTLSRELLLSLLDRDPALRESLLAGSRASCGASPGTSRSSTSSISPDDLRVDSPAWPVKPTRMPTR